MGIMRDMRKVYNRTAFFLSPKPRAAYDPVPLVADIFVGVGAACLPVEMIDHAGLRFCSCPLDWMIYPLKSAEKLYKNGFEGYFEEIREDHNESGARNNRRVIDIRNNVISIHHFPKHLSLEEGKALFRKISRDRFRRLDEFFRKARRVVFVSSRTESLEDIASFTRTLQEMYGFHASHIHVREVEPADRHMRELHLNDNVRCYEYQIPNYKNVDKKEARGALLRKHEWMRVLKCCSVTNLLPRPTFDLTKRSENWVAAVTDEAAAPALVK